MTTTTINCGIYTIHCTATDKIYIGSSNDIARRFVEHKFTLSNGDHHNSALQADWNKFGSKEFIFRAAEECNWYDMRWRELVNIYDIYSFFDLYNHPSIKDKIVYGIGKHLYDNCFGFIVDRKIMIDNKWYNFNLAVEGDPCTYISLRNDDYDFVRGAESYALKAEYVASINGRFTEFCYNNNSSDKEVQGIINNAIAYIEGVSM